MNVLSLFDGIGCGYLALQKAGVKIDNYFASEIDRGAIEIATHHNPTIIQIGDVKNVGYFTDDQGGWIMTPDKSYAVNIDLLIGGSPCTDFSSIGYTRGMKSGMAEITSLDQYLDLKAEGAKIEGQSYLFWEYIRLLNQIKPKYFLLENVKMAKKWQKVINDAIGCEPIEINSSLLSAQNRPRLYWTNIPNVTVPENKNICLDDILDNKADTKDVCHCKTIQKAFPKLLSKYGYIPERFNAYNASKIENKACALSRGSMVTSSCATLLFVKCTDGKHIVKNGLFDNLYKTNLSDGLYNIRRLSIKEMERLQTLPDNYTNIDGLGVQKRSASIGNGWTVDVIAHIFSFI